LDSELFISQTKAQTLHHPFQDGRSTVANRYHATQQLTNPEMVSVMAHLALRAGLLVGYLLAEA
jgi:hypothetical protein